MNFAKSTEHADFVKPEQFQCPKGILNPQFPVYVICRDKMHKDGDESLCQEFRDTRRAVLKKSRISFPRYVQILKKRTDETFAVRAT